MTNETEMSAPKTLYEEPSWRYLTRRYVTLFWLGGTLVVLLGFVTAILSGYFLGFPRLGEYNYNLQSWVVLGLVGGGGSIVFASSLVSEVRLTRRASIQLDEIVLGRGGDDGWFRSLLGKSPGPARIAIGSVLRFRLETFDPFRTFPTYRWYRAWHAEFDLMDGHVVRLDPSIDGFFHPLALKALVELASHLKERGVDVEVEEAGTFHLWRRREKPSE